MPLAVECPQEGATGIEALAETIVVKCILQNLVVHEVKGRSKQPKLGVCAGQRRLAALDLLFSQGRITKDYLVPVLIVSEGEAVAASLIENREREAMHISDESVAFRLLTEEGKSVAHIAILFKVSEMVVRRALKIANLAPTLLDLLRDDTMDYEQAKVLALADDHPTQERVWNDAHNAWQRRPSELRAAITKAEIDARDSALAKFVGTCSATASTPGTSRMPTCCTGSRPTGSSRFRKPFNPKRAGHGWRGARAATQTN